MASASVPGGASHGRRRSLDAELNLVPFIDLLSMCICFLLMTAVWIEVRAMHIKQLVGTEGAAAPTAVFEMDVVLRSASDLDVSIKKGSKVTKKYSVKATDSEDLRLKFRDSLKDLLAMVGINHQGDSKSKVTELFSAARVTPHQSVNYGDLVSVMDILRDVGVANLGVVPVR